MHTSIICLLIDDDSDDQEIFGMALAKVSMSICCIVANDGHEAIEKLHTDDSFIPDLIFLDLNMPRMNGMQCLKEIRKLDRLQDVPVIVYSTSSELKDFMESKQLGANDYLTKQSSLSALISKLTEVFKKYNYSFTPA